MTSQPPDESSQAENTTLSESEQQNVFNSWSSILRFLIKREGRAIMLFLLGFLGVVTLVSGIVTYKVLQHMEPEQIEITTQLGRITIKKGETQKAFFSLSPNGGNEGDPWVDTGIEIKQGDVIKITASGRVNTSLKRLVATTINPEVDERNWVDPSGINSEKDLTHNEFYAQAKVLPDGENISYGFGMLLAAIRSPDNQEDISKENIKPFSKNKKSIEFEAKYNGRLVLTVNDIWLAPGKKNVFVPPLKGHYQHYLQLAKFEAALKEDFRSWSDEMEQKKVDEMYAKRLKNWNTIKRNKNWNIWYDDNIGSFSVSITVNPEEE